MKHVTNLVDVSLLGTNGNAFALMAAWRKAARQQGTPDSEIEAVIADCTSGDYEHLLDVLIANSEEE